MRTSLLVGLSLALTAAVAVLVSPVFDLQIESVALLGAAVGAVVALVPDSTPLTRLTATVAGVGYALVGFVLRAAVLPDSASGRAVAVAVVVLMCTGAAVVTFNRLPLWAGLLGAAMFAGAYEAAYAAAPPELATTAVNTLTAVLVALAVGFLATSWAAPRVAERPSAAVVAEPVTGSVAEPVVDELDDRSDLDLLLGGEPGDDRTRTDVRLENAR